MDHHNIFLQPHLLYHVWINGDMDNYYEFMAGHSLIKSDIYKFNLLDSPLLKKVKYRFIFLKLIYSTYHRHKKTALPKLRELYNIAKNKSIEAIQLPNLVLHNLTIKQIPHVEGLSSDTDHPKYLIARVHIENNFSTSNEDGNTMDAVHIINKFQQHLGRRWEKSWTHIYDEWWELKILVSGKTEIYNTFFPSRMADFLNGVKKCAIILLINYGFNINKNMYEWHLAQGLVSNLQRN